MDDRSTCTAARAAARAFGTPAGPLRPVRAGPSPLFDVPLADGRRVALRLHDPDSDRRAIDDGLRLTEALADAGLATPWPQRTLDGARTASIDGRVASAMQWVPAAALPAGPGDPARLHAIGALLADFHLTADAVAPADLHLPDRRPPAPAVPDTAAADDPALAATTRAARAAWVAQADAPIGILRDDPGGVLAGADGLWLIGLDRAGTGWRAQDMAAALWPHADAPDLPALRDALVAGYVAGGGAASDSGHDRIALCLLLRALATAVTGQPDAALRVRVAAMAAALC